MQPCSLLDDCDVKNKRLHATGYQTLLKLVENLYNSLPIGFSYDRSMSNTPLLKIISPNFFKMGRNNDRAMDGPVHLPNGSEMVKRVNELYQGLFKVWADSYIPKLIYSPKWYVDGESLKPGDLVYMKKSPDNKLDSTWIIGIVEQAPIGRDGKVRRVIVKYHNASESGPQLTDRSIRTLVKIFDIDEYILQDDLAELLRRLSGSVGDEENQQVDCSNVVLYSDISFPTLGAPCLVPQKNPYLVSSLVESVTEMSPVVTDCTVSVIMDQSFGLAVNELMSSKFVFDDSGSCLQSGVSLLEDQDAMDLFLATSSRSCSGGPGMF